MVQIQQHSKGSEDSIIIISILPGEKTPWHYHTLFSEKFEILKGSLEIGLSGKISEFTEGGQVMVDRLRKHYFHNKSKNECVVRVTVSPGNKNFENALQIFKGLAKDGLLSRSGTPKRLIDLAVFVYLNNSKMVGFQKLGQPIFSLLVTLARKNGRMAELISKYCK
ncbi:cupin domain-containing protein [Aquimarina sp. U1-2]|uniref:cupin domain-containing protein n=1 Tax=Aquimarina sp. U1-2 TaxID=2823141 RepID=UPI001AEC9840|nr:cupin domain-containing protein [Aquimarina sp. U1-2]MBP2833743.1 cupin domain-containing protein [Aquimarina sp. U1-2]